MKLDRDPEFIKEEELAEVGRFNASIESLYLHTDMAAIQLFRENMPQYLVDAYMLVNELQSTYPDQEFNEDSVEELLHDGAEAGRVLFHQGISDSRGEFFRHVERAYVGTRIQREKSNPESVGYKRREAKRTAFRSAVYLVLQHGKIMPDFSSPETEA